MSVESWASIPQFDGLYEVSDLGGIRNPRTMKPLKPRKDCDGYLMVTLWKGSPVKQYDLKVHRLVLMSFVEHSDLKADHINRKRDDNRLENLRWASDDLNSRNHTTKNGCVRCRPNRKNPWQAYCHINRKFRSLGHFRTLEEALEMRLGFERIFGYGNYS